MTRAGLSRGAGFFVKPIERKGYRHAACLQTNSAWLCRLIRKARSHGCIKRVGSDYSSSTLRTCNRIQRTSAFEWNNGRGSE